MKKTVILLFLCLTANTFFGQKSDYAVTHIPAELIKADAVVRDYSVNYDIQSPSKATLRERRVITLLNDNTHLNTLYLHYDKFKKIEDISGRLYDADGKFIRKISKKEIIDQSAVSGYSIYEDDRIKIIEINYFQYPYTVEFEYKANYRGIRSYPDWSPQFNHYGVAVQNASYRVAVPSDMDIRHRTLNFEPVFNQKKEKGTTIYEWQTNQLSPLKEELYAPTKLDIFPIVDIAPTRFSVDGHQGDMSTWQSFGQFIYDLNKGRGIPTETTRKTVESITKGLTNKQDKIAALYKYLQEKNRYVSVQLGIGGWQSFDTKYVEKNKYGDCKALSYYMKAMLDAADIEAYPVLIQSGRNPLKIEDSYVSPRFNHMILYVPEEDIWLECTSTYNTPGHIGSDNENRKVLLITPEGGKLVNTPTSTSQHNVSDAKIQVQLNEQGSAQVSVRSTKIGNMQDWHRAAKNSLSEKELNEELQELLESLPSFIIDNQEIIIEKDTPRCTYNYDLTIRKLATIQGKRLFIRPNVIHQYSYKHDKEKERKQRIVNHRAYTQKDLIEIDLPEGYTAESLPENIDIQTDFGSYKTTFDVSGNQLLHNRTLTVNSYDLPPDRYQDMLEFYRQVKASDLKKAVFVK